MVKRQLVRQTTTKEHDYEKVEVFCKSCTAIKFVLAMKMLMRMNERWKASIRIYSRGLQNLSRLKLQISAG